jgi:hypothetical protein
LNVQTIRLPSSKAGIYRVQLGNGQIFQIEIPGSQDNKLVPKPTSLGGLGVLNDVTSYTNIISEQEREKMRQQILSDAKKPLGSNSGYSNLQHELTGCGSIENPYKNNLPKLLKARGF